MDHVKRYRQYQRLYKSAKRSLRQTLPESDHSDIDEEDAGCSQVQDHCDVQSHDESRIFPTYLQSHAGNCSDDTDSENNRSHSKADSSDDDTWDGIDNHVTLSSESEYEEGQISLATNLAMWTNKFQVKHNAVDELLKMLRGYGHASLPQSARTLLKCMRNVATEQKSDMEYIYLDMSTQLLKNFHKYPSEVRQTVANLQISLNIDGLPLFKSSSKTLWPVLCSINLNPITVFPVTLCLGHTKPSNLDFLTDAVQGLQIVLRDGLQDGERNIPVTLKCIVCDAPARAMTKNIKLYSGYYGCDKCSQKGLWVGRVTYNKVDNVELRTDNSFRAQEQQEHHHGFSPFLDLDVDMIKQFPVDYMHQVCLGVMKRLLLSWKRGKKEVRLSAAMINKISENLESLKPSIPNCFTRKPRGLRELDRWKATEYRQFLLYTGKLVLKNILKPALYNHFMVLSVAICLLVSPELAHVHVDYAHQLLIYFVKQGRRLYGKEFLVYNVHTMTHLAEDVKELGNLDSFSAFPFESYLHNLKTMVRSGKGALTQIVKRLSEVDSVKATLEPKPLLLSDKAPNNAYFLHDGCCCEVLQLMDRPGMDKMMRCRVYTRSSPLFHDPCDSSLIGAHTVRDAYAHIRIMPANKLKTRALKLELKDKIIYLAVLHGL